LSPQYFHQQLSRDLATGSDKKKQHVHAQSPTRLLSLAWPDRFFPAPTQNGELEALKIKINVIITTPSAAGWSGNPRKQMPWTVERLKVRRYDII